MGRFKKAVLIYNGNAGQTDAGQSLGICIPILSREIDELIVAKTKEPGDAEALCRRYGEDTELVISIGGDGTVHECINGLSVLKKRPAFAILPGGTCNDFSRTLEIPQDLGRAAETILSGEAVPIDVLKVNDRYALNFWGTGLITETSNNIKETEKALFGKVSYYLSAIRTIRQMEPFAYKVVCDGEEIEGEAVMIIAMNGRHIGANLLPFQNISPSDGKLNLFLIKQANMALIKEILFADATIDEEQRMNEMRHCQGSSVTIHTSTAMDADTDGEVYMKTPAEITVLNHHLTIIRPLPEEAGLGAIGK